jgi:hypothetical protein
MNRLRLLFIGAAALIFGIVLAQPVLATIKTQQAQIGVTIIVNVTPSPLAYVPHQAPAGNQPVIATAFSLHPAPSSLQHAFHAEGLHFMGAAKTIAQAQVQNSNLVQAEVTPNPKATMLYSNNNSVVVNAIAGTTVVIPCAFTVTVDLVAAWSLEQGVSNDFASSFPGKDLANNTYSSLATPLPTATPYAVYADDDSVWTIIESGTSLETYCVTLTLTVPGTVSAGTYSTNAVYTLYAG